MTAALRKPTDAEGNDAIYLPAIIAKLGMVSPCQNLAKEKRRPGSRCSATNNHQQQGLLAQVRTGLPL
jgi:hypothetical protein